MRKGWVSKKVHENAWGLHFTRWYIRSANGNFYEIYRGAYFKRIYMTMDVNDTSKAKWLAQTWRDAIKELYKIEDSGKYPKQLSKDIENNSECKMMFASGKSSYSYCSM